VLCSYNVIFCLQVVCLCNQMATDVNVVAVSLVLLTHCLLPLHCQGWQNYAHGVCLYVRAHVHVLAGKHRLIRSHLNCIKTLHT